MTDNRMKACPCGTDYSIQLDECPTCHRTTYKKITTPPPVPVRQPSQTNAIDDFEKAVAGHIFGLRVRDEGNRRYQAEKTPPPDDPTTTVLDQFLAEPDDTPAWRVADLWPTEGNIILAAQFKAGKTTLIGNLVRVLADGGSFLGSDMNWVIGDRHVATQLTPGETVCVLDLELPRRTLREWLRAHRIDNPDRVHVESLRGQAGTLRLTDPERLTAWAKKLTEINCQVLVVDPLAPLLRACGVDENDNSGIADVAAALDELKHAAGVRELLVVHHMGHNGERSRGGSRLRDWPDVEWRLNREDDDPSSPRYFTAFGRDVDVAEQRLEYVRENRRLTLAGGTRRDATRDRIKGDIIRLVTEQPGVVTGAIQKGITGRNEEVDTALKELIKSGTIVVQKMGPGYYHYLAGTIEQGVTK